MTQPPDVLLVVMDCARADLFEAEVARGTGTPFLASLRQESLIFPGAVAPASWTIPSHASLFTGLYPWDHGAHYRSGPILTGQKETLAGALARAGYATGCFTANGYLQPATGLTRGFDEVDWGGDREFFFRCLSLQHPSAPDLGGPETAHFGRLPDSPKPSPVWNSVIAAFSRFTPLWDGANRVGARFLGHPPSDLALVAPWIEPRLEAWLASQPRERPTFAFVNLLEAHEPYLVDAGAPVSLARWLSYLSVRQGEYVWVQGRWKPSPNDVARARECYCRSFRALDERLRRLVDAYRRQGRWSNTLLVLTSDHGQAFLEHDTFYHRFRIDEELTRIPLWVRGPGVRSPGTSVDRWVSLVDVGRTVSDSAGLAPFGDPESRSLLDGDRIPDDRAVYTMADGLTPNEAAELPASRRELLDRFEIAAYRGGFKSVVDRATDPRVFRVSRRDPSVPASVESAGADGQDAAELARRAFEVASARISAEPAHGSVQRRLAGWGY